MTHDEMNARIEAICEELGLEMQNDNIESDDGKLKGETFGFPRDQVEALSDEQKERLAQLRHDLLVDATGTRVSFKTVELPPGSHNVDPEATEPIKRQWMTLEVDAETLHNIFVLAAAGSAMLGKVVGKNVDPLQIQGLLSSEFPNRTAALHGLYKIEELTSIIEREHQAFGQAQVADELAAFIASDEDLFVDDILKGGE